MLDKEGNEVILSENVKGMELFAGLEGEALLEALEKNGGKLQFEIPSDLNKDLKVKIICEDYAMKTSGETNQQETVFENVLVTTSQWVMFYKNPVAFYGTIAGIIVLAGLIIYLIIWKKRKKENSK